MKPLILALCALALGCHAAQPAGGNDCGGSRSSSSGCDVVDCWTTAHSFPTFDKACRIASDCFIAVHQFNCCGSTQAIGINNAEQDRFAAAESTCVDQYAMCGCAKYATTAEDGRYAMDGQTIVVDCQLGTCMTAVK